MSVGILLITHDDIGSSLLVSLQKMLGALPLPVRVLPIRHEDEPLAFCYHAESLCQTLNEGHGVLVLTDLFGATPCNIACSLIHHHRVRVVAGINLPMLIKIMNYPLADLDTLASKALSGSCQGVLDVNSVFSEQCNCEL
ncbi:MAG: PTS fructose transporter subunit IIA [Gammaproteobacteria bacterium]|nr:MAG: PTS fructose transporter subunit IIA [Gammaproteobacteria bacterium]RKZ76608.1 MAG: PTS fructose transporter subunit IIA [Gammaproteobacteria bacterium]